MKIRNALKKYFKKRTAAVDALMMKQDTLFTREDFHRLRLEIKKIRALTAMLKSVKNFKSKKILKPLKKLFDHAGKVREIQLVETALKRYDPRHDLTSYLNHLNSKELQEKERFSKGHYAVNSKLKKVFTGISVIIKKVHKSDLKKYVESKKKEINKIVKQEKLKISQIHELRKALKKLHYNIKSVDLKDKIFQNDDAVQELMGKWHDTRVMYWHLLRAMDNQQLTKTERKPVLAITEKLNLKSRRLFEKINRKKQELNG